MRTLVMWSSATVVKTANESTQKGISCKSNSASSLQRPQKESNGPIMPNWQAFGLPKFATGPWPALPTVDAKSMCAAGISHSDAVCMSTLRDY
eukprot:630767-Pleurochrysis_carterae.AAC.1